MALAAPVASRSMYATVIVLTILCTIDLTEVSRQFSTIGISNFWGDFGGARIPGMFASAGTAGYFSVGAGLFALTAKRVNRLLRMALLICGFIVGYSSGTRVAIICYGLFFFAFLSEARDVRLRVAAAMAAAPLAIAMAAILTLNAGRGNPFDQTNGGRFDKWSDLYERSLVKGRQVISASISNNLRVLGVGSRISRRAELRA